MNVAAAFPADVATLATTRRFVELVLEGVDATAEQVDAAALAAQLESTPIGRLRAGC